MQPKTAVCRIFFPPQTVNVAYFHRKIQLSGISAYPDSSPPQLIRIIGVLLYSINVVQTPSNEFLLGKKNALFHSEL